MAGIPLIGFDPQYCYEFQWLFENDNVPCPHKETYSDIDSAFGHLMGLMPRIKELTHISISRRLK